MRRSAPCLAVMLLAAPVRAQDDDDSESLRALSTLTLELGGLVFSNRLGIGLEHAVAPWLSISITPGAVLGYAEGAFLSPLSGMWGVDLAVEPRFFVLGAAPDGLYVSAVGEAAWVVAGGRTGLSLGGGGMVGYNFVPLQLFDFSMGIGAVYRSDRFLGAGAPPGGAGLAPALRLGLGMVF